MAHDSSAWGGTPIGDRYVAAKYSEAEREQLAHDFARQAEKEHAPVVGRLRRAFELALRDLGVDPASARISTSPASSPTASTSPPTSAREGGWDCGWTASPSTGAR